jgi:hypothetical protein
MAQAPQQTPAPPQALAKITPVKKAPPAPPAPAIRPTDADLEAVISKAERGGDLGDVDVAAWMMKVQEATKELARRKLTGEYGKVVAVPDPEPPFDPPEPQVGERGTATPQPEPTEAERTRQYYEWLREQWVAEHPERQAAYSSKLNTTRPITSRIATDALKFNSDPTAFLTTARTAIDAADTAKQALEAVEQGLREKFDAAARAMGFPGA